MRAPIVCLGAGRMGRGIAVAYAYGGHQVTLVDLKERDVEAFDELERSARDEIARTLESLSGSGLFAPEAVPTLASRVRTRPYGERAGPLGTQPDLRG